MVDIDLHRTVFVGVLKAIYADAILRTLLGFKGGTAAMFCYDLPRFSVDLDFNLLDPEKKDVVLERLKILLGQFGELREATEKHFTLFFLLNYKKGERNLKIEISKRPLKAEYAIKQYLGISMLVMTEADMVAAKLAALLTRKRFAPRDVYDVWFFLKNHWDINEEFLKVQTGMTLVPALKAAVKKVQPVKATELLGGLGELLDNKQKTWAREHLVEDAVFQLRLRLDMVERRAKRIA